MFGGAASPGKTSALLLAALQYAHVPGYAALILRRTYRDLALPGAIMDRAKEWLVGKAGWAEDDKRFTFKSGATLTFGYLESERDKYRYQGSELQFCAFDELTQFTQSQYLYLFSRLRRNANVNVPLRMRSASNPGGIGHTWVHERFVNPVTRGDRVFIPARIEDNPHIDQDAYRESLAQLDSITRRQLEHGEWVRDGTGLLYRFNAETNLVTELPKWKVPLYGFGVDFGASETKPTTAIVVCMAGSDSRKICIVHSESMTAVGPSDIAARIQTLFDEYKPVSLVVDAGALGAGYLRDFQQVYGLPATAAEKQNKLGYRKLLNGDFERGDVAIWEPGNSELVAELQNLQWNKDGTDSEKGQPDHLTDAMAYGWRAMRELSGEETEPLPKPGTPAYYEAQEAAIEEDEENEAASSSDWWEE